jgi:hypothetical protein
LENNRFAKDRAGNPTSFIFRKEVKEVEPLRNWPREGTDVINPPRANSNASETLAPIPRLLMSCIKDTGETFTPFQIVLFANSKVDDESEIDLDRFISTPNASIRTRYISAKSRLNITISSPKIS